MLKILILLVAIFATTLSASKLQNYISMDKNASLSHVKVLVENGENVNGDKEDISWKLISLGATPLFYAAASNRLDIVKYLVENGADINLKGRGTPLNVASYLNEYKIVEYLLENGADPYIRNSKGYDSFFLGKKNPKIVALLKKYKVKVRMTYEEELKAPYGLNVDFKYYTNLEEAISKSAQVHKPIFTFVGRTNCKYCKILKKNALSDKRVLARLEKDFVVLVLDANKRVPNKYYTPGVPAIWFLSSDGEPLFQAIVGAREANDLLNAFVIVKKTYNKK